MFSLHVDDAEGGESWKKKSWPRPYPYFLPLPLLLAPYPYFPFSFYTTDPDAVLFGGSLIESSPSSSMTLGEEGLGKENPGPDPTPTFCPYPYFSRFFFRTDPEAVLFGCSLIECTLLVDDVEGGESWQNKILAQTLPLLFAPTPTFCPYPYFSGPAVAPKAHGYLATFSAPSIRLLATQLHPNTSRKQRCSTQGPNE